MIFALRIFCNLEVISGKQLIILAIFMDMERWVSITLRDRVVSEYYSSTPEEKDPQGMMQLPRNCSLQNIFLYRKTTPYSMRNDNRTLHHVTWPCLYATFSSQKYFDIPFSFLIALFLWKSPSTGSGLWIWLENHREKREERGRRGERRENRKRGDRQRETISNTNIKNLTWCGRIITVSQETCFKSQSCQ